MCPSPLSSPPLGERVAEGRVRGRGKVPRRTKLAPGFLRSNRGTGGFTSPRRWKRHCAAGGRDEIQLMRFSKRTEQRDQKKERSSRQNRPRDQDRSAPTYLRGGKSGIPEYQFLEKRSEDERDWSLVELLDS